MNVFISWSGERSRQVAEELQKWIRCVIQSAKPWISTKDIDRGSLWMSEIGAQLQETNMGILCITKENQNAPWILFEAGALAKGLPSSRVCTLLVDLEPNEIRGPLLQFNHTKFSEDGIRQLVSTINRHTERPVDGATLGSVFDKFWQDFKDKHAHILNTTANPEPAKPIDQQTLLSDVALALSSLQNRMASIENSLMNQSNSRSLGFGPSATEVGLLSFPDDRIRDFVESGMRNGHSYETMMKRWPGQLTEERMNRNKNAKNPKDSG